MSDERDAIRSGRVAAGDGTVATADWLDSLLADDAREHAGDYLADDGFSARIMAALPTPAEVPAWRRPAVTALWGVAIVGLAFALPGAAVDVAREAFKLFSAKPFSLSEVAAVLAVAGLGTWSSAYYAWKRV
ncbi:MAG: hypothetical protein ABIR52_01960 [Casimicrobiaceae bacterium]